MSEEKFTEILMQQAERQVAKAAAERNQQQEATNEAWLRRYDSLNTGNPLQKLARFR